MNLDPNPFHPKFKTEWDSRPNPYQSKDCFYPYRVKILIVFVSNPSTLAHICQSIRYNLVYVLLLSCFVKVRCLSYGFKSTLCPKSNPIQTISTICAPFPLHFHSISISIWISTPLKGSNAHIRVIILSESPKRIYAISILSMLISSIT